MTSLETFADEEMRKEPPLQSSLAMGAAAILPAPSQKD
jgi:hypothetical protein